MFNKTDLFMSLTVKAVSLRAARPVGAEAGAGHQIPHGKSTHPLQYTVYY